MPPCEVAPSLVVSEPQEGKSFFFFPAQIPRPRMQRPLEYGGTHPFPWSQSRPGIWCHAFVEAAIPIFTAEDAKA